MSRHMRRKGSTVFGAAALIVALATAPVSALTVITTATPDKIEGKSGTVTYTVTVTDCEDPVLGCLIFGVADENTVCTPGVRGCTDGPVAECGPALIGGLAGPDTYECTYQRTYTSDTPGVVTDRTTVEGFIGLTLVPFSISSSETVGIKAKPSTGTNTGTTGGSTGSITTGQNVSVNVPRVAVPDANSVARRAARTIRTTNATVISNEAEAEANRPNVDAESIEAQVRSQLR